MHILQITNHGLHEWQITPGLPDTGGQNVYVNHLSAALVALGHEVTIVNRGGYPHPLTGEVRSGTVVGLDGLARIVYLTDSSPRFVRKEDMEAQVPELADDLSKLMRRGQFDLILSHYWDGALLGILANQSRPDPLPHYWIPHSLGALKRRNVDPAAYADLRIDERIAVEHRLMGLVDGVIATSVAIQNSVASDYGSRADYFLPPGVDYRRFRPRSAVECASTWDFLAEVMDTDVDVIRGRPLILEVSRTDTTKRKDMLLRAFAAVADSEPRPLLAVTIDDINQHLYARLARLIDELRIGNDVAVLGSVWDELPCLHSEAAIYCSPSIMEGFGMSVQEAAAAGTPVVASDRIPFATEYLLGESPAAHRTAAGTTIAVGAGAIVVPADSVDGFAAALGLLMSDEELRKQQGEAGHSIVVPAFGWDRLTASLLDSIFEALDGQ